MRYPLWLFLFVFIVPPFALHAVLAGKASFIDAPAVAITATVTPDPLVHQF
ncbi:MAG TPA: hypothetical protein VNS12_04260 [Pelagibacterium sp.]|uniref:hypothetical protein n=1 Tax=Pelagibacterium sp. TaxID=1967288 RepID=UPI002CE008AC|nr:hypothetical protein [Pelagibacterium sp.]HWJ87264.1 hypothetical protein [Pelagibacterium sp.]